MVPFTHREAGAKIMPMRGDDPIKHSSVGLVEKCYQVNTLVLFGIAW